MRTSNGGVEGGELTTVYGGRSVRKSDSWGSFEDKLIVERGKLTGNEDSWVEMRTFNDLRDEEGR
jgi:hypothetical protein